MRILLANKFSYHRGGAERTFLDQSGWLKDAGHQVALLSQRPPDPWLPELEHRFVAPATLEGSWWRVLPHVGRLFWSPQVARATRELIDRFRPDVALLHNTYSPEHCRNLLDPSFERVGLGYADSANERGPFWVQTLGD